MHCALSDEQNNLPPPSPSTFNNTAQFHQTPDSIISISMTCCSSCSISLSWYEYRQPTAPTTAPSRTTAQSKSTSLNSNAMVNHGTKWTFLVHHTVCNTLVVEQQEVEKSVSSSRCITIAKHLCFGPKISNIAAHGSCGTGQFCRGRERPQ